jgi:hypothetical protein
MKYDSSFDDIVQILGTLQSRLVSIGSMLPCPLSGESLLRFIPPDIFCLGISRLSLLSGAFSSSLSLDEELLSELEQLLLSSDCIPVERFKSTLSANSAISGRSFSRVLYHCLDNFGLPRTVLCHTTGKLVALQRQRRH